MTQHIDSPPEKPQDHKTQPTPPQAIRSTRISIVTLLALVSLLLIILTAQLFIALNQHAQMAAQEASATATARANQLLTPSPTPQSDDNGLFQFSGKNPTDTLQVPGGQYVVYEAQDGLYAVQLGGGTPQKLDTPGYTYSRSIPPRVNSLGQVIYVGNGIWLSDIFGGTSRQIAAVDNNQVVTSLVLSSDGLSIAWSTAPKSGNGNVSLYTGALDHTKLVYQQANTNCPCFRVFSFLPNGKNQAPKQLLLTDDRGDRRSTQYGLWLLDLPSTQDNSLAQDQAPKSLLTDDVSQMPLLLTPASNALLYSTYSGVVTAPTDNSVPDDIAGQNNANSLAIVNLDASKATLGNAQVFLPEQHGLNNNADYHWVLSPQVSPDGLTLVYVIFSSDEQAPFARHSALYMTQINGNGKQVQVAKPGVLAITSARFVELGPWVNDHILTSYADNAIYAMDVTTGAMKTVIKGSGYMRILSIVQRGPE